MSSCGEDSHNQESLREQRTNTRTRRRTANNDVVRTEPKYPNQETKENIHYWESNDSSESCTSSQNAISHSDGRRMLATYSEGRDCWHLHFKKLVFEKNPLKEYTTTGVAESAIGEVKRETQKFHSILRWIPMLVSDAISLFRIGRDGLTADMRRSGRALKMLVVVVRAVATGTKPKLHVGRCLGHHGNWQHSRHDHRWSRESCTVLENERRESMEWLLERSSWYPLGRHRKRSKCCRCFSSPTT